jgi:hypothetical protein
MLRKRDSIFWVATGIFVASLVLARLGGDEFLLLMVGSYLLRPTLHSLGFAKKLIDERQMQIQYRASNVAFATMVVGNVIVVLSLMAQGNHVSEMVLAVLLIGLAARAIAGLLMVGDLSLAGPRILIVTGLFLVLFGAVEEGLSLGTVLHAVPGLVVVGVGLAARKQPGPIALLLFALVGLATAVFAFRLLRDGRLPEWGAMVTWLFIAGPMLVAAECLRRSRTQEARDEQVPASA